MDLKKKAKNKVVSTTHTRKLLLGILAFFILLLAGIGSNNLPIQAQNENAVSNYKESNVSQKDFDANNWQKITKGLNYDEVKKKPKPPPTPPPSTSNPNRSGGGTQAAPPTSSNPPIDFLGNLFNTDIFKYLAIGIILLLLAFLMYKIIKDGWFMQNKKVTPKTKVTAEILERLEEEQIEESELERLLRLVLEQKDYKIAVRIHYLMLITRLRELHWIKWKKDKTNAQYVREMRSQPSHKNFRSLTRIFERVWYGDADVNHEQYQAIAKRFKTFMGTLTKTKNTFVKETV